MTTERDIRFLNAAVAAALQGDRNGMEEAIAYMDPQAARDFWVALDAIQDCIEDTDGGDGERPWESHA